MKLNSRWNLKKVPFLWKCETSASHNKKTMKQSQRNWLHLVFFIAAGGRTYSCSRPGNTADGEQSKNWWYHLYCWRYEKSGKRECDRYLFWYTWGRWKGFISPNDIMPLKSKIRQCVIISAPHQWCCLMSIWMSTVIYHRYS